MVKCFFLHWIAFPALSKSVCYICVGQCGALYPVLIALFVHPWSTPHCLDYSGIWEKCVLWSWLECATTIFKSSWITMLSRHLYSYWFSDYFFYFEKRVLKSLVVIVHLFNFSDLSLVSLIYSEAYLLGAHTIKITISA